MPRAAFVFVMLLLVSVTACGQWVGPDYGKDFDKQWRDGKAELASYDLVYPRYGEKRQGTAVAITVTEPFLWEPRVKADDPGSAGNNAFGVVKLNFVEDFPTGVYDYNLMTSVFVATEATHGLPAGVPVKLTFTSQEWCGHVFQQAVFFKDKVAHESRSYFEQEADVDREFDGRQKFVAEDALFLWARGLAGPVVEPGARHTVALYRSAAVSRLRHVPVAWDSATLATARDTRTVHSDALGEVKVLTRTVSIERAGLGESAEYTFQVEAAAPHRVVSISRDDGYEATLAGVSREPYWQQNRPGGEKVLENLNLEPRPARTP